MKNKSLLLASLIFGIVLITGCTTTPVVVSQKEVARKDIEKISKIEIFYQPSEYVVMDLGGSSASGVAGIFGVFGTIAGIAIDASSKLTFRERASARSKEFTDLLKAEKAPDINALQAEYLAALIKKSGRDVKLTSIAQPTEIASLMDVKKPTDNNLNDHQGYARLILRVTSGYTAESATSSYKSLAATEYVLRDHEGKRLVSENLINKDNGETYMTFDRLKSSSKVAAESLGKNTIAQADEIFRQTFDLSSTTN
ncbi:MULTISPECIES: hypothetical protein [unclassified Undibacterium]|uniref:hypothetical protein n=1 Tax=unclassified Undibacterium TaxID=2630295 RepID=UPI002AC9A3B5|nr:MULTISPECIES: hypothetical protein [unclassified Undibacterium]MEB0140702.1 hypothetical protein [Undibacterium sp. CCC2.1]MEB0172319.1 hypothetical protein [Undibacterium sp. CCC1.1]MEB0176235.1 hypothetical protein [Undibacterium sp. CCC3.4]MEB0215525.1 hypothetical protein [Undibacterium sp. 5I2]WPX44329.1 hypothetical protein RHM61_03610 [Undibacterium sp. CCC3.4]